MTDDARTVLAQLEANADALIADVCRGLEEPGDREPLGDLILRLRARDGGGEKLYARPVTPR